MLNPIYRLTRRFLALLYVICIPLIGFAQNAFSVEGIMKDANGDPVIGASVVENGTTNSTVTDIEAAFKFKVRNGNSALKISYLGFKPQTIALNGRSKLEVKLVEDAANLGEVVVIGYGTMDKKELTSAVSHVSAKDFTRVASVDPSMMIQGKVPGVSITNTDVGDPNNEASIQIRGVSSRNAGLGPLIVINGIVGGNLTNLNPNDIESFDILKNGAASAIYGTRGSNGVILVTTKKGTRDGTLHTSYNGNVPFDIIKHELDMLSADEYRANRLPSGTGYDLGGNVDWLKEVSRVGVRTQHTLTQSGGNARSNYRTSLDYRDAKNATDPIVLTKTGDHKFIFKGKLKVGELKFTPDKEGFSASKSWFLSKTANAVIDDHGSSVEDVVDGSESKGTPNNKWKVTKAGKYKLPSI